MIWRGLRGMSFDVTRENGRAYWVGIALVAMSRGQQIERLFAD